MPSILQGQGAVIQSRIQQLQAEGYTTAQIQQILSGRPIEQSIGAADSVLMGNPIPAPAEIGPTPDGGGAPFNPTPPSAGGSPDIPGIPGGLNPVFLLGGAAIAFLLLRR